MGNARKRDPPISRHCLHRHRCTRLPHAVGIRCNARATLMRLSHEPCRPHPRTTTLTLSSTSTTLTASACPPLPRIAVSIAEVWNSDTSSSTCRSRRERGVPAQCRHFLLSPTTSSPATTSSSPASIHTFSLSLRENRRCSQDERDIVYWYVATTLCDNWH